MHTFHQNILFKKCRRIVIERLGKFVAHVLQCVNLMHRGIAAVYVGRHRVSVYHIKVKSLALQTVRIIGTDLVLVNPKIVGAFTLKVPAFERV
mgnify:CR=1 FL=1